MFGNCFKWNPFYFIQHKDFFLRSWQLIQSIDDYYKIEPFDVEEAERIGQTLRMVDVLVAEVHCVARPLGFGETARRIYRKL